MSATDDVARMLTLVPWLLERPGARIDEVAAAFGVDEETVRTDLAQLDVARLPGAGGFEVFWVTVVGDRVVLEMAEELRRPLRLTPREGLQLVLAVSAVADAVGEEIPPLRSGLRKVREALGIPAEVATQVGELPGATLTEARRGITEGRQIRLSYRGRKDRAPHARTIDPWALQVVDGVWYLQGRDHDVDELRTFRLDRVAELAVLGEARVEDPPEEELPTPAYVPGPDDMAVELHVEPEGRWLLDAVDAEEVVEADGGAVTVRLRTDAPRYLARLLVSAGSSVTVADPESLRETVLDLARQGLDRYEHTPTTD